MNEDEIKAAFDADDLEKACTGALKLYGEEIAGFLGAMLRDDDLAAEAFSVFCEDLWRGLPKFRWSSTMRTWLYTLARNAGHRSARDPKRKRDRNLPMSVVTAVSKLELQLRDSTAAWKRTEVKDRVRELRKELNADDQALLTLRLDRGLEWIDLARVFLEEEDGEATDENVKKKSAALRKRFERLKERLKKRAQELAT